MAFTEPRRTREQARLRKQHERVPRWRRSALDARAPGTQPSLLIGCNGANELGRLTGAIRGGAVEDGLAKLAIEHEGGDPSYAAALGCGEGCTVLRSVAISRRPQ
jgi:hypothetical protein